MATPLPYYPGHLAPKPRGLGLLAPPPGATCPRGEAGHPTCNYLGDHFPQAYKVENKELALVISCKNVQRSCHVRNCKAVNVAQQNIRKMHFLWHLLPAYSTRKCRKIRV